MGKIYTPIHGQKVPDISQLTANSYAWIAEAKVANLSRKKRNIGTIHNWQLIQLVKGLIANDQ